MRRLSFWVCWSVGGGRVLVLVCCVFTSVFVFLASLSSGLLYITVFAVVFLFHFLFFLLLLLLHLCHGYFVCDEKCVCVCVCVCVCMCVCFLYNQPVFFIYLYFPCLSIFSPSASISLEPRQSHVLHSRPITPSPVASSSCYSSRSMSLGRAVLYLKATLLFLPTRRLYH